MIEVKEISLKIGNKEILKNININVMDGECFGLVGRNGSGKTMLMKVICGFVPATAGSVFVDGAEIGKDRDFPADTGIIIETPGFIPAKSGFANLKNLADLNKRIDDEKIRDTMSFVGLDPDSKLHVSKYSLGMKQRLGLAQAIMEDPKVLILDEPFNGLDMEGVADMRGFLLKQKKEGKTIIVSSHIKEDIDLLCDKYVVMDKGEIIQRWPDE